MKESVRKAKPLACRLILAQRSGEDEGHETTYSDLEKVIKTDPAVYAELCSALAFYASAAISAIDTHFNEDWGSQMLDVWLIDALDEEASTDD